ncbi:MAG: hypothetical protein AAFV07_01355 [Bacteroidota bacterium]
MRILLRSLLITGLCFLYASLPAAILTVSNDPSQPAQYADITVAIAAASAGDTIYIHGTGDPYFSGTYTVDKQLVLIGPGKNPQKELSLLAELSGPGGGGGILEFTTGADGSQVFGLRIRNTIRCVGTVNNVLIQGCVIGSSISCDGTAMGANWVLKDNIVRTGQGVVNPNAINLNASATNWIIENNVFGGRIRNATGVIFRHNIFIQNQSGFGDTFTGACTGLQMEDNAFYGVSPQGCTSCTFDNNITFGAGNNNLPAGSTGSGNLIDQDPDFVDATLSVTTIQWRTFDFHLQSGSPAIGTGKSGDDIGLFGNPSTTQGGSANIPLIKSMSVDNPIVPAGGQLQLQLISTKPEGN